MSVTIGEPGWLGRVDRWGRAHGWVTDMLVALAAAAVLGALSVSGGRDLHWSPGLLATVVVAFAVLHASVAVRRRAPEVAYGLGCVAMLVIVLVPDARIPDPAAGGPTRVPIVLLPSTLVFLLDLYSAASRFDPLRRRLALAAALAGVVLATVSVGRVVRQVSGGGWLVDITIGLVLAVAVGLTWNLGRLAQVRRNRLSGERTESARVAVLEERARIAREMHDIVAHSLAVIVRQAEGGSYVAASDSDRAARAFTAIADTGREALAEMRGLLGVLRDPDTVPHSAPQPRIADLDGLVETVRATGRQVRLLSSGAPFELGPATELAVYRLVQEALTNVVKHAGADAQAEVHISWNESGLCVEVRDDGAGTSAALPGAGAGLRGLRDRVTALGATFGAGPDERGFTVSGRFPREAS